MLAQIALQLALAWWVFGGGGVFGGWGVCRGGETLVGRFCLIISTLLSSNCLFFPPSLIRVAPSAAAKFSFKNTFSWTQYFLSSVRPPSEEGLLTFRFKRTRSWCRSLLPLPREGGGSRGRGAFISGLHHKRRVSPPSEGEEGGTRERERGEFKPHPLNSRSPTRSPLSCAPARWCTFPPCTSGSTRRPARHNRIDNKNTTFNL